MWSNGAPAQSGRPRYICSLCGTTTTGSGDATRNAGYDTVAAAERSREIQRASKAGELRRLVVTAAQNNTPTHHRFLRSLERYCEDVGATLAVIPIHYKNISLYTAGQEYRKWWAPLVAPYLVDQRIELAGGVVLRADVKIAATAVNPLEGLSPIDGRRWTVFGHSQLRMEPVATPAGAKPKRMYSTGVVTERNYSNTKLGAKAHFHHVYGALVLETDGRHTWVRQLNADSRGRFYDLDALYEPERVTQGHRALSLTTGDEHVKWMRPGVLQATYTAGDSIVATLRPRYLVRHDVLDGYAGSHHHEGDDVVQYRKYWRGDGDYRAELDQLVRHLDRTTPRDVENWIVWSNHDDHLYKWLQRADPRRDPLNARLIHELKDAQYAAAERGEVANPLRLYVEPRVRCAVRFLDPSTPALLGGVDMSQHGHRGANGARGSAWGMAKAAYKMNIGHAHGARIIQGVYQAGKSTGQMEYEAGLGDHSNTHILQYPDGKRTLVDIFGRRWRA